MADPRVEVCATSRLVAYTTLEEPLSNRTGSELAGALWLDSETAELRSLEFGYVGLPYPEMDSFAGGLVEFDRLEDGSWIVRRWRLRVPEVELGPDRVRVPVVLETTATARIPVDGGGDEVMQDE